MQIEVFMKALNRSDSIKAVGSINFNGLKVKSVTLLENSKGELFVKMPSKDSGKVVDGKKKYIETAHPLTSNLRAELNDAAIKSYKSNRKVVIDDIDEAKVVVNAELFDRPYFNRVGKCELLISDKFVIKDIFINTKPDNSLYVTFPNYKVNDSKADKRYNELIEMEGSLKKEIKEVVISEYKAELANKENKRLTIQGRLSMAKEQVNNQISTMGHEKEQLGR